MPNSKLAGKTIGTIWNNSSRAPHYFDGRLLTASDLKTEQQAVMTHQRWLGQSSGYGVINGLVVTQLDDVQIRITPGIGLSQQGQLISLSTIYKFPLTLQVITTKPIDDAGLFSLCKVPDTATTTTSSIIDAGTYLLTATPASRFDGTVPMKTAAGGMATSTPGSGSQWEVEGVQFKAIPISLTNEPDGSPMNDNHRRNLLAHWCYGTDLLQGIGAAAELGMGFDPFNFNDPYSNLDPQSPAVLPDYTTADLPLAVFYWDGSALSFVDMWSARRRIIHPDALAGTQPAIYKSAWKAIVSDKRVAENQARLLQFQDQLAGLVARGSASGNNHLPLNTVQATDFFHYLPPADFLPITPDSIRDLLCPELKPGIVTEVKNVLTGAAQWLGGLAKIPRTFLNPFHLLSFLQRGVGSHPDVVDLKNQFGSVQKRLDAISASAGGSVSAETLATTPAAGLLGAAGEVLQGVETFGIPPAVDQPPLPPSQREPTPPQPQTQTTFEEGLRQQVCANLSSRVSATSGTGSFNLQTFFNMIPLRINLIRSERIDLILHRSWYEDAIDLSTLLAPSSMQGIQEDEPPGYPLIDIYLVEENVTDLNSQLYVIFHKISLEHVLLDPTEQMLLAGTSPGNVGV